MKKTNTFIKNQISEFDRIVSGTDQQSIFDNSFASEYEFKMLTGFMPKLKGARVLDVGCGTGRFVIPLAKIAKHVTGVDLSNDSIKTLNVQIKKEHLHNISAKVIDVHNLRSKQKYDYVLMVNVFHHVQDVKKLLRKIRTLLAKDGSLVLFEFNPLNPLFLPAFLFWGQLRVHANKESLRSNIWTLNRIFVESNYRLTRFSRYAFLPTALYNKHPFFVKINIWLNSLPCIQQFCAFHMLRFQPKNIHTT